eukprot:6191863-Pleurochrysis_carterae.AAC.2
MIQAFGRAPRCHATEERETESGPLHTVRLEIQQPFHGSTPLDITKRPRGVGMRRYPKSLENGTSAPHSYESTKTCGVHGIAASSASRAP